jgi:hypothetical protein
MIDLSHWDYATDFTAEQVASLMVGVDPADCDVAKRKIVPVLTRLNRAYRAALSKCEDRYLPWVEPSERPAYAGNELRGRLISQLEKSAINAKDIFDVLDRIDASHDLLQDDLFPRANVISWLTATGLKSIYRFDTHPPLASGSVPEVGGELKTSERNSLLKLLWGMASQGYKFDPTADRSEVPKEIAGDCAAAGVPIDPDTVRKYLREASQQADRSRR